MESAAKGLVGGVKVDDSEIVYSFTLSRRKSGTIAAERKTDEFDFDPNQSVIMMREFSAFLERQIIIAESAKLALQVFKETLANQKVLAQVKGGKLV